MNVMDFINVMEGMEFKNVKKPDKLLFGNVP